MNATTQSQLSRRGFLKAAGIATAIAACGNAFFGDSASASGGEAASDDAWGMLIDLTRCAGCESCVLACKRSNNLPNADKVPTKLDSGAYSYIQTTVDADSGQTYAVKRQCMHCLHPACASACTVGALRKSASGPVVYDADKCIGCRYCQYACPFGVPTYDWNNPLGLIHKCQFCAERLGEGRTTGVQ